MEQLNFVIPNNFETLSPELFESSYPKNNQLFFSISTHNQIPIVDNSRENQSDAFKKTTVRFQTASAEKILKDLKSKKNKKKSKKRNNISVNDQKKISNIQKIKNEWNDDIRTKGVFDESMNKKIFPVEVSKNRINEKEKPIYFNSLAELKEEKEKENDNKFINQIKRKKEEIKKTKLELEKEKKETKNIQKTFEENRKKFVEKNQKPNSSKKSLYFYPPQPKPIIESNQDKLQNLNMSSTLNKDKHKKNLLERKHEVINSLNNNPKNGVNKSYDEIPTKENGKRAEDLEFEKKMNRNPSQQKNNDNNQEKLFEMRKRSNSNPSSEKKIKNDTSNKQHKMIENNNDKLNTKIISIKRDLEPLMAVLKRKQNNDGKFPLGYNVLARTCSKLLNIHSDNLIELLIDDILIETAEVLNDIEKTEELKKEKQKGQEIFHDFLENFKELQFLQDQIFQRRDEMNKFETEFQKIKVDKSKIASIKIKKRVLKLDDLLIHNVLEKRNFNDLEGLNIDRKIIKEREEAAEEILEEIFEECFEEYKEIENNFVEELFKQEFN